MLNLIELNLSSRLVSQIELKYFFLNQNALVGTEYGLRVPAVCGV